ncbi:hypothetical protein Prum_058880 [Phytohabitans rumicis]|uniref:Uncharacterized protein n=1 Tax=Phytohabitans rumicis TaxID=1076125 RepID=A0A6V8LDS6_9ACTN|nr:hypothetical protein Prum_058880 [Phytohabitans rumicis]
MVINQNPDSPPRRRHRAAADAGATPAAIGTIPDGTCGVTVTPSTPDRNAEYVRMLVDSFPPLTEEQRAQLAVLIRDSLPTNSRSE